MNEGEQLLDLYHRKYSDAAIARRMGEPWTRRQVQWWRKQNQLPSHGKHFVAGRACDTPERKARYAARWHARLREVWYCHAVRHGWAHLLTFPADRSRGRADEVEGYPLTRRMVDVLTLLRDHGPMTRRQLSRSLCEHNRLFDGKSIRAILALLGWGLIEKQMAYRRETVYTLAPLAMLDITQHHAAGATEKSFSGAE